MPCIKARQPDEQVSVLCGELWETQQELGRHSAYQLVCVDRQKELGTPSWDICWCRDRRGLGQLTAKDTKETVPAIQCAWSWRSDTTAIDRSVTAIRVIVIVTMCRRNTVECGRLQYVIVHVSDYSCKRNCYK